MLRTRSAGTARPHVVIRLKTVQGTKRLQLDPAIYETILKEKIVGAVVYVEASTGTAKGCRIVWLHHFTCPKQRVGCADEYASSSDLESERYQRGRTYLREKRSSGM